MGRNLVLSFLLVLTACFLGGCGSSAPPGKEITGQDYNAIANQGVSEEDKAINAQMRKDAAIPGENRPGAR
jgi:hypothetical protein